MDETAALLDRLAMNAAMPPRSAQTCPCGCGRRRSCSSGFDEAVPLRRRRAAPGATSRRAAAVNPELRAWQGWSRPVSLAEIQRAQADQRQGRAVTDPVLRQMIASGGQVYRITRAGIDRGRPLTIGMTRRTGTIATRVTQHHAGPGGDRQVQQAIRNLSPGQVYVQAGRINARDRHNRRIKMFENWLQLRERPLIYNPDSTSFDEVARSRHHGSSCECESCCG